MRIYISGPMTGLPNNNRLAFAKAAGRLRVKGHFTISPAELSTLFGDDEELKSAFAAYYNPEKNARNIEDGALATAVLDADLAAVRSCDAIYLLKGWERSRGARLELEEALKYDLEVIQE